MTTEKIYQKLHQLSKETALLVGVESLLSWDQETMMPPGAAPIRAEQQALLANLIHRRATSTGFRNTLSQLIDMDTGEIRDPTSSPARIAALRDWRRIYLRNKALPRNFVTRFAKLTSESREAWRTARSENNFQLFKPYLKKIVSMSRKKADYYGFDEHPYDALLEDYEPGMSSSQVKQLFNSIRTPLSELARRIAQVKQVDDTILYGEFPLQPQMQLMERLLSNLGFTKAHNRLDLSTHPFSSACHPSDSRITTRTYPDSIHQNLLATLHEWGHSLYEMGLPPEEYGSPLGTHISLGIHESQSKWWETRVGQSQAFWIYFLPLLQEAFAEQFREVSINQAYHAINRVAPTPIRLCADEVTYPLHIILRFEIEVALIEGSLRVDELPEAWNNGMEELLGIRPKSDAEGCLQDIHWSLGALGYFPTYALGNIYTGQLFSTFEQKHPRWAEEIAVGDFESMRGWLKENVHRQGRRYQSVELVEHISGRPLSTDPYLKYLRDKYQAIYTLPTTKKPHCATMA